MSRSLRTGWGLASRAYDLFSPIAVGPRVPGVARLLTAGDDSSPGDEPGPDETSLRLADPILFLDGETGARVATAFLVENERDEPISAPIHVSPFAAPGGMTAAPEVTISPSVLELGPGEQALVNVTAVLGPELEADVRYLARISIPELSAVTVPIAARRRVAQAA